MELYKLYQLDKLPNFFQEELNRLAPSLNTSLGFESKRYNGDLSQEFKDQLRTFLETVLNKEEVVISKGWINYTKHDRLMNGLGWHNEIGLGANYNNVVKDQYMCVIWLDGETGQGGDFKYIHDETGEVVVVPFNPPSLMVMNKETIHAIEHYSGSRYRTSLNLNFR